MLLTTLSLFLAGAAPAIHAQAAPAAADAEKAAADRTKVVCKRFLETGSLVKGTRVCKTKWEWERERENVRQLNVPASSAENG